MVRVPGSRILELPEAANDLWPGLTVDDEVIVTLGESGEVVDWRLANGS